MIREAEFFYGASVARLLQGQTSGLTIRYLPDEAAYLVNEKIAIMPKYSTSRMSPWSFTFTLGQRIAFSDFSGKYVTFLILVCNDDGIVCLSTAEVLSLSVNDLNAHAIRITRGHGAMYKVSGPAGVLKYRLGLNEFPSKVLAGLS